jgi:hypothetical protein
MWSVWDRPYLGVCVVCELEVGTLRVEQQKDGFSTTPNECIHHQCHLPMADVFLLVSLFPCEEKWKISGDGTCGKVEDSIRLGISRNLQTQLALTRFTVFRQTMQQNTPFRVCTAAAHLRRFASEKRKKKWEKRN